MSKEIWDKNLKAMEKWYPAFVEMLQEEREIEDDIEILIEESWDGEKIFRMKRGDRMLYLNGRRNAKEPLRIWMERLGEIEKYVPIFLFGIGSGAYLKTVVAHTNKEVNIILYEPSASIFLTVLHEIDLSKEIEDRPIAFIVEGINEVEFEPVMDKVLVLENMELFREEVHPNYREFYLEQILRVIRLLHKKVADTRMQCNTGMLFHKNVAHNILRNMKYVCEGYHTRKLSEVIPYQGAAILVAAGPSLDKNILELKKAKNKAFIVAVDTAVKPLMKAGIVPDAFATIDPKKPLELIEAEGAEKIPIIAPPSAQSALLEHQTGKKIFFFDGHGLPYQIYARNHKSFSSLSTGGSVACNVFSLLYKMGFDTIILVGQDLAYTDDKSHADGTFQDRMPKENTEDMIMVKGNYQEKVPTLTNLKMYLEWFNMYIKGCKEHRNVRVINATEGGAFIEGTELMALKDILTEVCGEEEINFAERIEHMESEFTKEERNVAVEYLHTVPHQFEEIIKNAKQLKLSYQKLERLGKSGKIDKSSCRKEWKRIKKLTDSCHKKDVYDLVVSTMQMAENIVRGEFFFEEENAEAEIKEIARKGITYSGLLQECAGILEEVAKEVLLPIEA